MRRLWRGLQVRQVVLRGLDIFGRKVVWIHIHFFDGAAESGAAGILSSAGLVFVSDMLMQEFIEVCKTKLELRMPEKWGFRWL